MIVSPASASEEAEPSKVMSEAVLMFWTGPAFAIGAELVEVGLSSLPEQADSSRMNVVKTMVLSKYFIVNSLLNSFSYYTFPM